VSEARELTQSVSLGEVMQQMLEIKALNPQVNRYTILYIYTYLSIYIEVMQQMLEMKALNPQVNELFKYSNLQIFRPLRRWWDEVSAVQSRSILSQSPS
jgi:hypothetical protein